MPVISNVPATLDLEIYQGTSVSIPFQARDASGPINLTGYLIRAQIRKTRLSEEVVQTFSTTITNVAQGLFSIFLNAAQTAAITCGEKPTSSLSRYVWDLEMESPEGFVTQLRQGAVSVVAQVTR